MKSFLSVALEAGLSELILMGVLMAVCARSKLNSTELLEFFAIYHFNLMAFQAIDSFMLSFQLKSCRGVVEFRGALKRFRCVAIEACLRKCLMMIILVACKTGCLNTHVGILLGLQLLIRDVF